MERMDNTSETPISMPKRTTTQDKEQYESLLSRSDVDLDLHLNALDPRSRQQPWHSALFYVPAILTIIFGIALLAAYSTSLTQLHSVLDQMQGKLVSLDSAPVFVNTSKPTGDEFGHCGRNIKEARSLGCIFDPMSYAWQRPECYNAELIEDFLTSYDWHFFPNKELRPSEELPRENWTRGDYLGVTGSWAWHMYHCSYSWRKFHAALQYQKPLDDDVLDPEHTKHCSTTILLRDTDPKLHAPCEDDPESCQATQIWTRFNKCGYF